MAIPALLGKDSVVEEQSHFKRLIFLVLPTAIEPVFSP
jgi:hypothetical protein